MKLVIQIPCLNEESSLPLTLAELPKTLPGIDAIEVLVIDDGSVDRTVEVARAHGVHHVVSFHRRLGLARAFAIGLETSVRLGADIIVNTDADNQYRGADIATLIRPIVERRAEIVVGERPIRETDEFSFLKKALQRLGSRVVSYCSRVHIPDAPSGFRAFSRDAALQIHVFTEYSHTLEVLIQAGQKNIPIVTVPVRTNPSTRPSRLFRSIPEYIARSALTIVRVFVVYRPLIFFLSAASIFSAVGAILLGRFFYYYFTRTDSGHVQSLVVGVSCFVVAFLLLSLGVLADLIGVNRRLLERVAYTQQRQ